MNFINSLDILNLKASATLIGSQIITLNKFAYVDEIDSGNEEDVWTVGGELDSLTAAETLSVSSTDALSVLIEGIDNDYNLIEETVVLDGVTPTVTSNAFLAVYRAQVTEDSPAVNAGAITGTASTAGSVQFRIEATYGQTEMSHVVVPAGYTAFLIMYQVATSDGDEATVRFMQAVENGPYITKAVFQVVEGSSQHDYSVYPPAFKEKSRLKLRALSRDNNTRISANYQAVFIKNEILAS